MNAIEIEGLAKKFILNHNKSLTIRDSFRNVISPQKRSKPEEFWAINHLDLNIEQGTSVGIIGKNGAGKSTLLKLISKILYPTEGTIKILGTVGTLLEVGTGFHPELSGRENIFLNGTILGLKKSEIKKKFDDIVEFSGVEKFLDTPVKRYSSGMYVRLAFSVAAHLEPDILIVDEVLAVGDHEFQKKCLGKMGDVMKSGRTVLFVSHNLTAIKNICDKSMYLKNGVMQVYDETETVVNRYLEDFSSDISKIQQFSREDNPDIPAFIKSIRITDVNGKIVDFFNLFTDIYVTVVYEIKQELTGIHLFFDLLYNGQMLLRSYDTDTNDDLWKKREVKTYKTTFKLPNYLKAGNYLFKSVGIGIPGMGRIDSVDDQLGFMIEENDPEIIKKSYSSHRPGIIADNITWNYE